MRKLSLHGFIWHYIKKQKVGFFFMLLLPLGWSIEQSAFPYVIKMVIDTIVTHQDDRANIFSALAKPGWIGLGVWMMLIVYWRVLDWVDYKIVPKFQANLRMAMFDYALGHSHRYFADHFAGNIANKIADMSGSGWQVLYLIFRNFWPTIGAVILAASLFATINVWISVMFALFFLCHIAICLYFAKDCDRLSVTHSSTRSRLQGMIVDCFTNISNVRLFSRFGYERERIRTLQQQEIHDHGVMLKYMIKIRVLLEIPSFLVTVGILYVLVSTWQAGGVTPGEFVSIITVTFNIMLMVWRMGWEFPNFFRDVGACQQALEVMNVPHELLDAPDAKPLTVTKGEIIFDRVHFQYLPGIDIFRDKNITIPAGQKVGLVGFSGSGKSTFVNLILRLYDVEGGSILIDGQNVAEVTQDSLRAAIALIPQDTTLFHRSLMENIRYGRTDATDAAVIEAAKQAHCHEFIMEIPTGYEAEVGERGVKLSGGQRQRVAIARAVLKNAPILILDEATSSLDSITERTIQTTLKNMMESRTTIVIAHRLSTLVDMDRILVFKDGQIIEDGTHQELLESKGHYAKLWDMQAGGFLPDREA